VTTPEAEQARTVSSAVTVAVDPQTAFQVFTGEIDQWWVKGPINFYDSARAIGMRCEPGVGGRLLELYSDDASDALELGRITRWQPGELLAWDSAVDDVAVEVRFDRVAAGTRVTVLATIPAGGADKGGTAWVRVVPGWLGAWCERRGAAAGVPADTNRLGLAIYYLKAAAAARWLADAFGFAPASQYTGDDAGEHSWIEFRIGNCSVMLFPLEGARTENDPVTHAPWVFVDDLDAHFEHARQHGATIVTGIRQHGYRAYEAADCEGNRWTFAQARPTM
jgi:uncharacterized glyoxalase superfamily protein PhnB